jgi:hypothetical protein
MDYQLKYLKYKKKYIDLKNQLGGEFSCKIYLAITKGASPEFITFLNESSKIRYGDFPKYINIDSYPELNEKEMFLNLNRELTENISTITTSGWVDIYDKLMSVYILSDLSQQFWNQIAIDTQINIAIFYGHGHTFSIRRLGPDLTINADKYIVGLNILLGCTTDNHAKNLNTEYNSIGKYFIGFRDYLHMYGNNLYICTEDLTLNVDRLKEDYARLADNNLVKVAKLFHTQFHNRCTIPEKVPTPTPIPIPTSTPCRSCSVINRDYIISKINKIKVRMEPGKVFNTDNDYYFNSKFHCKCTEEGKVGHESCCNENIDFIGYINGLYEKYNPKPSPTPSYYDITLKTGTGRKQVIKVRKEDRLDSINDIIKDFIYVPEYKIMFGSKLLDDRTKTFSEYNILSGANIIIFGK